MIFAVKWLNIFLQGTERVNAGVNYPPQQESQHISPFYSFFSAFSVFFRCWIGVSVSRSWISCWRTALETLNHFLHITLTTEGSAFHRKSWQRIERKRSRFSKEKRDPCASQKGLCLKVSLFLEKEMRLSVAAWGQTHTHTTRKCVWAGSGHMSQMGRPALVSHPITESHCTVRGREDERLKRNDDQFRGFEEMLRAIDGSFHCEEEDKDDQILLLSHFYRESYQFVWPVWCGGNYFS